MTDQDITPVGPAFASASARTAPPPTSTTPAVVCSPNLPRKSVEPIALATGTVARTLQEFLTTAQWNHGLARAAAAPGRGDPLPSASQRAGDSVPQAPPPTPLRLTPCA